MNAHAAHPLTLQPAPPAVDPRDLPVGLDQSVEVEQSESWGDEIRVSVVGQIMGAYRLVFDVVVTDSGYENEPDIEIAEAHLYAIFGGFPDLERVSISGALSTFAACHLRSQVEDCAREGWIS